MPRPRNRRNRAGLPADTRRFNSLEALLQNFARKLMVIDSGRDVGLPVPSGRRLGKLRPGSRLGLFFCLRQFDSFVQYGAGSRIHVSRGIRDSHRFIGVMVFHNIFGSKALNAVSGLGTAVDKKWHCSDKPR
jgi:hypothetical protein